MVQLFPIRVFDEPIRRCVKLQTCVLNMESEFRTLVDGNQNFNGVTLEKFSALPEANVAIYFDTATIHGTNFMSEIMVLRKRFNQSQG